jgi:aryl-alcohol dehydrogenase-like predicted oxidoreductase
MVHSGYVKHIGLSEVGSASLRKAVAVHPIADLQIEYSLISRGIEAGVLPTCRELGVGVTAYGVLSRGLISGHWRKGELGQGDFRTHIPRFQGENVDKNLALVEALRAVAAAKGATVAQTAIAWALAQGADVVPLIGARRRDRLAEALGALDVALTAEDIEAIEKVVPEGASLRIRPASAAPRRKWRFSTASGSEGRDPSHPCCPALKGYWPATKSGASKFAAISGCCLSSVRSLTWVIT